MNFQKKMELKNKVNNVFQIICIVVLSPIIGLFALFIFAEELVEKVSTKVSNYCQKIYRTKFFSRYKSSISKKVIKDKEEDLQCWGECSLDKSYFNFESNFKSAHRLRNEIFQYVYFCKQHDINYDFDYFNNELAIHMKKYKDIVVEFKEDEYGQQIRVYKLKRNKRR